MGCTYSINSGNKSKAGFPATLIQGGMELTFESVCVQDGPSRPEMFQDVLQMAPISPQTCMMHLRRSPFL